MTRILSIDTTSKQVSLALAEDSQVIQEYNIKSHREISSILVPLISSMLENVGWQIEDIDLFGICVGPGLFTGIRIGLATLKGLVFDTPKPMVPVTSLEALAYKQHTYGHYPVIVPLIDAKRDEIYLAGFENSRFFPREILAPRLAHIDELTDEIKDISNPFFTGTGVDAHLEKLNELFGSDRLLCRSPYLAPEICAIAHREFKKGSATQDLQAILPLYIRQPDAQQNYDKIAPKTNLRKSQP